MPREVAYLIGGFALGLAVVFLIPEKQQQPIDTSIFDTRDSLKNLILDSLYRVNDSLKLEVNQTDTAYIEIEKEIQNKYNEVDTTNNADSLILQIKRAIQFSRTQRDTQSTN